MKTTTKLQLFPLSSVRLLDSPFQAAIAANRSYMLALDPDRLLAPFRREAGLQPRKPSYGNWESTGLDGHTAGHYLSALADMIAAGADTPDRPLSRRLDYMLDELAACQKEGQGYVGGIPGSKALWKDIAAGQLKVNGMGLNGKWVPWYNLHKTFAGLRDAYLVAGNPKARPLLIGLGDWCERETAALSDAQIQEMLNAEHGGMNEVLADIYAITGDEKYLKLAKRFNHQAVLNPIIAHRDELTGKHANTQIPKVIGLNRIGALTGDQPAESGARYFWENVTHTRSIAFGGNSVGEHFNDPKDFRKMLESREGPETCNTYNMLRLTEQLFCQEPEAQYADFYERALYNHLLSAIHPSHPGYVYFTPIRPNHYRVYSEPDYSFWCCVGTGMENPGRYGQFIYAKSGDGYYVNLFIPSEVSDGAVKLRQETSFPDEERTRLTVTLPAPKDFTLYLRHPAWISEKRLWVTVNGEPFKLSSEPSSYAALRRTWENGDKIEVRLPMTTTLERLPDNSNWYAILHGPILLAHPSGTQDLVGLRADDSRMAHIAHGPLAPLDQAPALLASAGEVPLHINPDPAAGPLQFRIKDILEPSEAAGLNLIPFFRLHDSRYQIYWELTSPNEAAARKEKLAQSEKEKARREAATIDSVSPGEQQPEVEHEFLGEKSKSGLVQGRRWRDGAMLQYTLNARGEKAAELVVTYWGGDDGRTFDIFVNDQLLATENLHKEKPGEFFDRRYPIPSETLAAAKGGKVTVRLVAKRLVAGGIFDLRLEKPAGR